MGDAATETSNGSGSGATIRELYRLLQESDQRNDKALADFRAEMSARLDNVLQNQHAAALAAAERTGRDDARITSLEMAIQKAGDETTKIPTVVGRLNTAEERLDTVEEHQRTEDTRSFVRITIAGVVTSLFGTGSIVGILIATGVIGKGH